MRTQNCNLDILLQCISPMYSCQRCYAVRQEVPCNASTMPAHCLVCDMPYCPTAPGEAIQFDNLFEHGRTFSILASRARGFLAAPHGAPPPYAYPPVRALLDAFCYAQRFVHFTTCGISHQLIGALMMTAQRVHVRGLIAEVEGSILEELTCPEAAPYLDLRLLPLEGETPRPETLIVVDGLVAFRGLTSLTLHGLRQAAARGTTVDVVTDVHAVMQYHNILFSTLWAAYGQRLLTTMEETPTKTTDIDEARKEIMKPLDVAPEDDDPSFLYDWINPT